MDEHSGGNIFYLARTVQNTYFVYCWKDTYLTKLHICNLLSTLSRYFFSAIRNGNSILSCRANRDGFRASKIDAVVLSHAHTDHAGNLPNLVENGLSGPIYSTSATRDLCNVMLYDSAYIQERDTEYVNKKHRIKGEPEITALYSVQDVTRTMEQFVRVEYHQQFRVADGIECMHSDAGHILGSTVTRLSIDDDGVEINR